MLTEEQLNALGGAHIEPLTTDDIISLGDTMIDISNQGAACETYQIDSIDLSGISTITLPTSSVTYAGSGATVGYSGSCYTINTGSSYSGNGISWSTIAPQTSTVNIDSNGIDVKEGADIKVNGRSLSEFMTKMEQRLSILVPDPEKLEKFEALKKAYEHYKTMEALCFPEKEEKEK